MLTENSMGEGDSRVKSHSPARKVASALDCHLSHDKSSDDGDASPLSNKGGKLVGKYLPQARSRLSGGVDDLEVLGIKDGTRSKK